MIDLAEVRERFQEARDLRSEYEPHFEELARLFLPRASNFYTGSDGRKQAYRYHHCIDNTGMRVISQGAKRMVSALIPKGGGWGVIGISPFLKQFLDQESLHMVELACEQATNVMMSYLNDSNFRQAMISAAETYLTFGNVCVFPMYENGRINFHTAAPDKLWLEPCSDSTKAGVFWSRQMSPRSARKMYPMINLPEAQSERRVSLINAVLPDDKGMFEKVVLFTPSGYGQWGSGDNLQPVEHVQLPNGMPVIAYGRMNVSSGETYGNGIGAMMLPEVQNLQTRRRLALIADFYHSNPVFMVESAISPIDFKIEPGATIPIDKELSTTNMPIMPLQIGGNPSVAHQSINESRGIIRDEIGTLPPITENPPYRSATEMLIFQKHMAQQTVGDSDMFADQVMRPAMEIAVRMIQMNEGTIPSEIIVDQRTYQINISSDDERARQLEEVQKVQATSEMMAQMPPEAVLGTVNYGRAIREVYQRLDLTHLLNSPQETEEYYKARQEAMQQQQQGGAMQQ